MTEKQIAILLKMAQNLTTTLDKIDNLLAEKQGASHDDLELLAVQIVGVAMQVSQVIVLQTMEGDRE